ncbi:Cornifin domain-containing protein [Abeliophyllum distichum]|uniref:Cornifin domain-containing protein n=1 Tax=Abeliophyllum distichum TaxID=126358 RepID=A0ABD1RTV2_9LAMI
MPEEVGQVDHPKYYKSHRIISYPMMWCFVLKDLIVLLDKENKIKLETRENLTVSCSMVSFGSFDPIPISSEGQTFTFTYDAGKSLFDVIEFGHQILEGAILVELKIDG